MSIESTVLEMAYLLHPDAHEAKEIEAATESAIHFKGINAISGSILYQAGKGYKQYKLAKTIFFPDMYEKANRQAWLPNADCTKLGTTLVTASIRKHACSEIRESLNYWRIQYDFKSLTMSLEFHLYRTYSETTRFHWRRFAKLFSRVQRELPRARGMYRNILFASANDHSIQYSQGSLQHSESECYNHWVKYMALGATVSETNRLIYDVIEAGFPVPLVIRPFVWETFLYHGYRVIDGSKTDDEARPSVIQYHNPYGSSKNCCY
ncbi:unnamed protein product [Agarophyton chilense]